MPLTEEQRRAMPELRALFTSAEVQFGTSMPFDQRARLPTTGVPEDIAVRVEIAPPLSAPLPLVDKSAMRKAERVPLFYYSLRDRNSTPDALEDTKVIFYVHGGGNVESHPTDVRYIDLFDEILHATATVWGDSVPCTIIAPCYRLATVPENAFPGALQDVLAAYDYVVGQGYKPSNITVAGDSAGGNHAVVLTHLALESGRPAPDGVVAIAPASMQAYDDVSEQAKAQASGDLLTMEMYKLGANVYIGDSGYAATDPLISGSLISFTESWPRTLILTGTADQLIDATKGLELRLARLKRPVQVVEYDERPHCWWLARAVFGEEMLDAARRIARFASDM